MDLVKFNGVVDGFRRSMIALGSALRVQNSTCLRMYNDENQEILD